MSKRVCVVVASRANYARVKSVLHAIREHPELDLQLVVGASALLTRFGKVIDVIREDGFEVDDVIHYVVEGENLETQAKTTGLGIIELTTTFSRLDPHFVLTVADRYETMATAIAATYCHIPLIHVQGGEVSGNIDDRVRHAITKLADLHFPCTEQSRERIIKMGEDASVVFNYGCPAIDIALSSDRSIDNEAMDAYKGSGDPLDWTKPYILLVQHPVTTSFGSGCDQITASLTALLDFPDHQKVVLWPNIDAGSDDVAKGIRLFREHNKGAGHVYHYFRNFTPEDYIRVIGSAACCVGNSSSFIREGSALGVPVVLVGDRQQNREHGQNIRFSDYGREAVSAALRAQLEGSRPEPEAIFGSGQAGERIADCIATVSLPDIKQIQY